MSHQNNGSCLSCAALFNKYPDFYQLLRDWFMAIQLKNPEAHISCAGRGQIEQESLFQRGATKAHYGESSHNYNAAIDIFELRDGTYTLDPEWFRIKIGYQLDPSFKWYGSPGASFYELPHVELAAWRDLKQNGILKLVE